MPLALFLVFSILLDFDAFASVAVSRAFYELSRRSRRIVLVVEGGAVMMRRASGGHFSLVTTVTDCLARSVGHL